MENKDKAVSASDESVKSPLKDDTIQTVRPRFTDLYEQDEINHCVKDDKSILAYFNVKVQSVSEITDTASGETTRKYTLCFYVDDAPINATVTDEALDKLDYRKISSRLLLNPKKASAKKELAFLIRSLADEVKTENVWLFSKLGWTSYNCGNYYCTPDYVFTPHGVVEEDEIYKDGAAVLSTGKLTDDLRFHVPEYKSHEKCVNFMRDMISLNPVIALSGLLGTMREIIIDAGKNFPCAVYAAGKTQSRKTTFSLLATQLFEEQSPESNYCISRVDSSASVIQKKSARVKDTVFIIDDLHYTNDVTIRRQYEGTINALLRPFADNRTVETEKSSFTIKNLLLITGEYLLSDLTNLGRCFVTIIDEPIDSLALKELQTKQNCFHYKEEYYYYFIKYLAQHYKEITKRFRAVDLYDGSDKYSRLTGMRTLFGITLEIFLDVCNHLLEKNSEEIPDWTDWKADILFRLKAEEDTQRKIMEALDQGGIDKYNLAAFILKAYKKKIIHHKPHEKYDEDDDEDMTYDIEQPVKPVSRLRFPDSTALPVLAIKISTVRKLLADDGVRMTDNEIKAYFVSKGMTDTYSDGSLKKLSKNNNSRYLRLYMDMLEKETDSDITKYSYLFPYAKK